MKLKKVILITITTSMIALAGCSTSPQLKSSQNHFDYNKIPDAIPKPEPKNQYGNPDCYKVDGQTYQVMKTADGYCKTGLASWYGLKFHGRKTSSKEPYNMFAMTAASRNLPIPTYVEVTNLENGKKIVVKVNDRGPFKSDRLIDLSYGAAAKLGFANKGTVAVEVKAIDMQTFKSSRIAPEMVLANNQLDLPEIQINPAALTKPTQFNKPIVLERYLQLGAFSICANAKRLQQQIVSYTDAPILINEGTINNKPIYRVQIGPFKDVGESEKILHKLKAEGFNVITIFS